MADLPSGHAVPLSLSAGNWTTFTNPLSHTKTLSEFPFDGCLLYEMTDRSDTQLLREYVELANEAAFREIVLRYTHLVYSSALRQVGSPDLALDVAQIVFSDLARKARPLSRSHNSGNSLLGWLYRSTRFAALSQLRADRRRQVRERQAMEHFQPSPENLLDWDQAQPVLDEAMLELNDEDREAVLLRFFNNADFRTIGQFLGLSDDAAQKRVSRALHKLRDCLASRGVITTAAALSTTLSTNAVLPAPAGAASALSAGALAGASIAAATTGPVSQIIVMTTLQKTAIGLTLALLAGAGIYQTHRVSKLRAQVETLQQQQAPLLEQLRQRSELGEGTNSQLARLQNENYELRKTAA